jgi:hypothetical protein
MKTSLVILISAVIAVWAVGVQMGVRGHPGPETVQMTGQTRHLLSMLQLHLLRHPEAEARLPLESGVEVDLTAEFNAMARDYARDNGGVPGFADGSCVIAGSRMKGLRVFRAGTGEVIAEASMVNEVTGKVVKVESSLGKFE